MNNYKNKSTCLLTTDPGSPLRPSVPGFPGTPWGPTGPVFPGGPTAPGSPCDGDKNHYDLIAAIVSSR